MKANLLILFFISALVSKAQILYYDVLKLKNHTQLELSVSGKVVINNNDTTSTIFKYYSLSDSNPFIIISGTVESFNPNNDILNKGFIPSIGGLNVTTYADAMAKFLVKRVKQELSIAFFERFKQDLEEQEELKVLFPNTFRLLKVIDTEIYTFSGYLNTLRESFEKDLSTLIPNLRKALDNGLFQSYLKNNPLLNSILYDALYIGDELASGIHSGDVLNNYANNNSLNEYITNFNPTLKTLNLFSQAIRSKHPHQYWVSSDSLNLLLNDEITFRIFLGLLYQQSKGITFTVEDKPSELTEILKKISTNYNQYAPEIKKVIKDIQRKGQSVDEHLQIIITKDKSDSSKSNYNDHYAFYQASLSFLKSVTKLCELSLFNQFALDNTSIKQFFEIADITGNIYIDINKRKYFNAIVNTTALFQEILPEAIDINTLKNDINSLKKDINDGKVSVLGEFLEKYDRFKKIPEYEIINEKFSLSYDESMKKELNSLLIEFFKVVENNNKIVNEVLPKLIKYGNLAASVSQAKDSDEIASVIESIALPAGSARIKRESAQNFSLNAYVGFFGGREWNPYPAFTTGLSAPIGFAYSIGGWGNGKDNKKGGKALTFFVPIIDIGTLVSFRFQDDSTDIASDIKLQNIFAPGFFVYLGLGKIPVSIGSGVQYGPRLHTVTADNIENYDDYYLRWTITAAIDIPVLNLYNKGK